MDTLGRHRPDNIADAARSGASIIDLNSRFETEPGIKDYALLRDAFDKIRNIQ